jgi:hypothetical protein
MGQAAPKGRVSRGKSGERQAGVAARNVKARRAISGSITAPEFRLSSITPVSYQATYVPVTPVRPVVYGGSRPPEPAAASDRGGGAEVSAAKPSGQGQLLDIKV